MDADRVRVEIADGVADVRMVRADKHNGLDGRMFEAINDAIDELREANEVRAVVLAGDGPSFCAGLDFKSFTAEGGPNSASSAPTARRRTSHRRSPTAGASLRSR